MKSIGSYEAKTHLPRLLSQVEQGETITITKRGRPVAVLSPAPPMPQREVKAGVPGTPEFRGHHTEFRGHHTQFRRPMRRSASIVPTFRGRHTQFRRPVRRSKFRGRHTQFRRPVRRSA